ncbi:uncharacterized protein BDW43DRAFT_306340 [Aspergillus alliaceus]|uniref:uncharacterized protein n=1 Tax=Petromyces alliaceus TaxID=209559 RepID=UPI0012A5527F|nr:uncharacterized protein BDW43DRAFT_306340 [Aspergillus alliaceus]KAB8238478.1 hypothetical protein BDW43DRAFT_306340 [Aspergillus alliaceus]
MVHVHVDPDKQKTRQAFDRDLVPPNLIPNYFLLDDFGGLFPTSFCAPQAESVSCPKKLTECEESQMYSWLESNDCRSMGLNDIANKSLMTHEAMSNDFGHWPDAITSKCFENSKAQSHDDRTQLPSQDPFMQSAREITMHDGHGQHEQSSIKQERSIGEEQDPADDVMFGIAHPIPRLPSLIMTGNSLIGPETESAATLSLRTPDNSCEIQYNDDNVQNPEWEATELEVSELSEGSSVRNVNNFIPISGPATPPPRSTFGTRAPWDAQRQNISRGDTLWADSPCGLSMTGLCGYFNKSFDHTLPTVNNDLHSLPLQENACQYYTQPAMSASQRRFENVGFALAKEHAGCLGCDPIQLYYENSYFHHLVHPNLATNRSYFPREQLSGKQIVYRNDSRDAFLVECKRRGLSYKDIKRIGGFKEAESTLRGRFRTLTKSKDQRVRKPQWQEKDVNLLCEAVDACLEGEKQARSAYSLSSRPPTASQLPKVSWKRVAEYIWTHGGSYQFGNATCKKKWCDIHGLKI